MKVKELIKQLQDLTPEEQERNVVFRQYDKQENGYYYTTISDTYMELVTSTTHPMYDYYEFITEGLRINEDDEIEEVIVIE